MSEKAIVLELTTERPEPLYVTINKVQYPLVSPDEMAVADYLWSMGATRRLFGMYGKEELEDNDLIYIDDTLDRAVRIYLPTLPAEIFEQLPDFAKFAVLNAFFETVEKRIREAPRSDSTKSSPASDGSTEAITPIGDASQ